MQAAVEASAEAAEDGDAVVISGERKLLDVTDIASDMDRLRKMFALFEKRPTCCSCWTSPAARRACRLHRRRFPAGADGRGVRHHRALRVDGKVVGTLGVIGPTRMAYERVIPIVDITARLLSNALSHNQ